MHKLIMLNYDFYHLFFYFLTYSFLGWCGEILYAYKNQKKFVNRGFLYGPLCPIYGFCVLTLVICCENFKENILILFTFATILISTIEYFTALFLEKVFKTKWWDYTEDPFNLHGRICLHFSLMWGAASSFVVLVIQPIVTSLIDSIPTTIGLISFYIIISILLIDFASTLTSLIDFKKIPLNMQLNTGYFSSKSFELIQNAKRLINFRRK